MNNLRLLTRLVVVALLSGGMRSYGQSVMTLEEIFKVTEANSAQLRPSFMAQTEAEHATSVARAGRLPDINASLSVSYIGDGFTTKRNLSDYQKAPIPHFENGLSLNVTQPLYTGGAVTNAIKLSELEWTAVRYAADFQRDNIRFRLTGFYLDVYKYTNLRRVVESNLSATGATLGPALIGEFLRHTMARNASLLGSNIVDFNPDIGNVRPFTIFPKWSTIRLDIKHIVWTRS